MVAAGLEGTKLGGHCLMALLGGKKALETNGFQ